MWLPRDKGGNLEQYQNNHLKNLPDSSSSTTITTGNSAKNGKGGDVTERPSKRRRISSSFLLLTHLRNDTWRHCTIPYKAAEQEGCKFAHKLGRLLLLGSSASSWRHNNGPNVLKALMEQKRDSWMKFPKARKLIAKLFRKILFNILDLTQQSA